MIPRPIDQIEKQDIQDLIDNGIREGATVEYKQELHGPSRKEKIELCKDVSAFANARGGDLILGVKEKEGIPVQAHGLGEDLDAELLRIMATLRTCIDPTLLRIDDRIVEGFPKGPVLVLRVPRSFAQPHVVAFEGHNQFYTRDSNGSHRMDVHELRSAFAFSESLPQRLRGFRGERIARIRASETPVPLSGSSPKVILHLVPFSALDPASRIDLPTFQSILSRVRPLYSTPGGGWSERYNFDGYLTYNSQVSTYLLTFHNGAMEAVTSALILGEPKVITRELETELIQHLGEMLIASKQVGLQAPVYLLLSLLDIKGYAIESADRYIRDQQHPVDRRELLFQDVQIDDLTHEAAGILRPVFDSLWQACGLERCYSYREDGTYA